MLPGRSGGDDTIRDAERVKQSTEGGHRVEPTEIAYLSATELIAAYRTRTLSPVEVAQATLDRIERIDPTLNAFVTVTGDLAVEQARAAEAAYAEGSAGALAGVPLSIKDITVTAGIRTTFGSHGRAGYVPTEDAPLVERARDAGAVMVGKTTTPEFGWKGETSSPLLGTTRNPWDLARTPGGSSGGAAAAVAAGLGPLAHGTDGAGSIRIPASFSGVFGVKPSYGLIPVYPASAVGDLAHWGPITRTVADAALFMDVTAHADARDRTSWGGPGGYRAALDAPSPPDLRVAWSADLGYAAVEPEVARVAEQAAVALADALGVELVRDHPALDDPWPIEDAIWSAGMAALYEDSLVAFREQLDPGLLAVIAFGRSLSAVDLATAARRRNVYCDGWRRFMERYDVVLTPTLPCIAFPVGQDQPHAVAGRDVGYLSWTALTYPFNLTGQPAATVPCGFDDQGLPVGLQIVGRWRDDATVLRVAAAFERAMPWRQHRPPVG